VSDVGTWSTTDASNSSAAPNGFPEGMKPSDLNNAGRAVMGAVARWFFDTNGSLSAGGSTNTYTLSTNAGFSTTAEHSLLVFRVPIKCDGASTLNVDGLGAKPLRRAGGGALVDGDIVANTTVAVAWNDTQQYYEILGRQTRDITLLASGSVTSAVASVTFTPNAGYTSAILDFYGLRPVTDGTTLYLRLGTGTAISGAADYEWAKVQTDSSATNTGTGDTADSEMEIFTGAGNAAQEYISGRIFVHNLRDANARPAAEWHIGGQNSTDLHVNSTGAGSFVGQTSVHALTLLFSSGNISAPGGATSAVFTYRLYGVP